MYRGLVFDRLNNFNPVARTRYYKTYAEAHRAVERLAKKWGDRAEIVVRGPGNIRGI